MRSAISAIRRSACLTTAPVRRGDGVSEAHPLTERLPAEHSIARSEARRDGGMFASLTVHDFRYLWFGTLASQIGMWVQQVALGWLAYDLTGSATFLGVIALARSIPAVTLTLPA